MKFYDNVLYNYNLFSQNLDINNELITKLKRADNEIIFNFLVKLENNKVELFKGFRVQHNNLLGPYKGGIRFYNTVNLNEINTLAFLMSLKCSLLNLPFGGAKGGIDINPNLYSNNDLKKISKEYAIKLNKFIGKNIDIPAPDIGTTDELIDIMAFNQQSDNKKATFTGKSLLFGGSKLRKEATGLGLVMCIRKYAKLNNINLKNKNYILQGFGNVGFHVFKYLNNEGCKLIAVGDHTGYYFNLKGFNFETLNHKINLTNNLQYLETYINCKKINKEEFFKLECFMIIPCALELEINTEIANNIKSKIIIEGANGPIDYKADKILDNKNIIIIPDIIANSGGVIVSYFEWVQNNIYESWEYDEIYNKLEKKINFYFSKVFNKSIKDKISMREAAYKISLLNLNNIYNKFLIN